MNTPQTIIELIAEQSAETRSPSSLAEGLGTLRLLIHRLETELSKPEEDQDTEKLFHEFVGISSIAMATAGNLLLPEMERGSR